MVSNGFAIMENGRVFFIFYFVTESIQSIEVIDSISLKTTLVTILCPKTNVKMKYTGYL